MCFDTEDKFGQKDFRNRPPSQTTRDALVLLFQVSNPSQ